MLQRKQNFVRLLTPFVERIWQSCRALVSIELAVGLLAAIVGAGLSLVIDPVTRTHDEHSYLLAADTLLHGRLANPTPPAWQSLQTLHVVMEPTYASKYPLGVGIVVALGIALFGSALASSWLSAGLMAASSTWMLRGILSRRWAFFGGLFVAFHPILQTTWSQSLMHGYSVATGCALLTGAILRLRRRYSLQTSVIAGVGISILALTRPFEGLVCTLLSAIVLWSLWNRLSLHERFARSVAVSRIAVIPVLLALICIGAQNKSVTGDWFKLPYQLHEQSFGVAPLFVFGEPRMENTVPREELSTTVQRFHATDSLNWYNGRIGWRGWRIGLSEMLREVSLLGFPFVLLLIPAVSIWYRWRVARWIAVACIAQTAASASVCWVFSHYAAPLLPWLLLVSLIAGRGAARAIAKRLNCCMKPTRVTQILFASVLVVEIVSIGFATNASRIVDQNDWAVARQRIIERLHAAGGNHLVLVRYAADHNVHQEWVYNSADPMQSPIVWARDERAEWTAEALKHYGANRTIWSLDADSDWSMRQIAIFQ